MIKFAEPEFDTTQALTDNEVNHLRKYYRPILRDCIMTTDEKVGYLCASFAIDPGLQSYRTLDNCFKAIRYSWKKITAP